MTYTCRKADNITNEYHYRNIPCSAQTFCVLSYSVLFTPGHTLRMCVGNNVRHTHTHTVYQHRNVLKPHAVRCMKEPIRRVIWCAAQSTMHFAHGVSWDACSPGVVAPADRYTTRDHVITQSVMHNMLPMATIVSE